MSENPKFSQARIDAFTKTLTDWAKSLPPNEEAMLEHLLSRATGGPLSERQLAQVADGLKRESSFDWMQWAQRQY
jgi:hypothetical protein